MLGNWPRDTFSKLEYLFESIYTLCRCKDCSLFRIAERIGLVLYKDGIRGNESRLRPMGTKLCYAKKAMKGKTHALEARSKHI